MADQPVVDLIIPVHDKSRPIRRAVESAIRGISPHRVRVTVICHDLPAGEIAANLEGVAQSSVRLIEFSDGIRSPTGPFNEGLRLATGRYVAVMGSDDFLEPGALPALIDHVERRDSDVVLVRLRHQHGAMLDNPLVRRVGPFSRERRSHDLDVVRDRLFYRTAPLGLIRRELLEQHAIRFTERMAVGGDLAVGSWLWTHAPRIDLLSAAPGYVIGADAVGRVTMQHRAISVVMTPVHDLLDRHWVAALPGRTKNSLVVKLIRIHILGACAARPTPDDWDDDDLADLSAAFTRMLRLAPGALSPFSQADRAVLDALVHDSASVEGVVRAIGRRSSAPRWATVLPRNPLRALDREGTLVRYLLYRSLR